MNVVGQVKAGVESDFNQTNSVYTPIITSILKFIS